METAAKKRGRPRKGQQNAGKGTKRKRRSPMTSEELADLVQAAGKWAAKIGALLGGFVEIGFITWDKDSARVELTELGRKRGLTSGRNSSLSFYRGLASHLYRRQHDPFSLFDPIVYESWLKHWRDFYAQAKPDLFN